MINAGDLDKLVTLEKPVIERSAAGEDLPAKWVAYARVWANLKPISATERIRNENVVTQQSTHIITLRYTPQLDSSHRVTIGARQFEISSAINVDERNEEWRLLAHEAT